jgi:hypothetical protein
LQYPTEMPIRSAAVVLLWVSRSCVELPSISKIGTRGPPIELFITGVFSLEAQIQRIIAAQ